MANQPVNTVGFPSHFVDPAQKGKEWCMAYAKAFHLEAKTSPTECSLIRNNQDYAVLRQYGRGEQSENQYKELMGLKRDGKDGRAALNTSYRNLDFSILKIVPKMKNTLSGQILNNGYRIGVRPIDSTSINERRTERLKLTEMIINQESIERFERNSRMGLERPLEPGVEPPQSLREIDPYLDMNPKDALSMEIKDLLMMSLTDNNWPDLEDEIVTDLIDLGVAAVHPYLDQNGITKLKRGFPERMYTNRCLKPDFSDAIRIGEYYEITIADLKVRTQNSLGEDAYRIIADTVAGSGKTGTRYAAHYREYWQEASYSYAYDREKITVFAAWWYSHDTMAYIERKNERGNTMLEKKSWNYVPYKGDMSVNSGLGVSDEEYERMSSGARKVLREERRNVYQCHWIVDTPYCFEFGLMKNMKRNSSSYCDTTLPWVIRTTNFQSPVGMIMSPADQVQLNWLQFQSHIASSKPDGIAIEKRSLAKLSEGGQAGEKWDPKEALRMYAEIGSTVFDGYDHHGNPLPWLPIKELKNGLSEAAFSHLNIIIQMIDLMRQILGINSMVEGALPPERMGKAVAQLSFGATNNALTYLTRTYKSLYQGVAKMIVDLIPNNMDYQPAQDKITNALGRETSLLFRLNREIGLREMGIIIEEGPDDELKARISEAVKIALDRKEIETEDALMVLNETNLYRAQTLLKKKKRETRALRMQEEQQKMMAQSEGNMQLEQVKAQTVEQQEEQKHRRAIELESIKTQLKKSVDQEKFLHEIVLKKLDAKQSLTEIEQNFINDMMLLRAQGQQDRMTASITARQRETSQTNQK